jgi:lactate 2-monooxygenase
MLELSVREAHSPRTVEGIAARTESAGRKRQHEVYLAGVRSGLPEVPVSFQTLDERARSMMSARAFAYLAGSAGLSRAG